MNNTENPNNQNKTTSADNKTRSFTQPKKVDNDGEMVLDTAVNIKKATAKKVIKKSATISFVTFKKVFQWAGSILLTLLLIGTICGIIVGGAFAIYVKNYLIEDYDITELKQNLDMTTTIFYVDGDGNQVEMEDERIYGSENRSWVSYSTMPKHLVDAFLAIEDERYWVHNGVDWRRTIGAVLEFVTGNDNYGGSTITQQLIKNVSGEDDTTIQRKVKEIFRALSLTEKRSKEEILEMYLNRIHLSRSNYGVQAAANYYFGKDVSELTLVESAALASIPKSPTKYDPIRNPEFNAERRVLVLDKMLELEWISQEEYDKAIGEELVLNITYEEATSEASKPYSYFKDALIEQLVADLGEEYGYSRQYALDLIYSGGLQITVTMDPEIQRIMEEVYTDPATFQKVDDGIQPQSAMVIMDPYTGNVLGLVGGRGEKNGKLELNRATMSRRQVGSSIKPLTVYAPAMDLGLIEYSTIYDDTPIYMENMNKYWPSNSPNEYKGKITINEAIVRSKNTVAVKIIKDDLGVDYAYNFAKNKLHINSLVPSDRDVAPLALGGLTHGITVMEMTAAYTIFPNGGTYSAPRLYTRVLNADGTILLDNPIEQEPVISEGTAAVMTKMLQNVVTSGTAARLTLDQKVNIAGKTGSTNDNKDVYFCGFSPYYVGAAWFGYDISKSLYKFTSNPAMLAWEKVMERIHERHFNSGEKIKTFDFSELQQASFCLDSGDAPTEKCEHDIRGSRISTGYYYNGEGAPKRACSTHVEVNWCNGTNMLASPYCPEESTRTVSLIREDDRSFMHGDVPVVDSKFTYRYVDIASYEDIPEGAPFYKMLLQEGETTGYNKDYKEGDAINAMCRVHQPAEEPELSEEIPDNSENADDETDIGDGSSSDASSDDVPAEIPEDIPGFEVSDSDYDNTLDDNHDDMPDDTDENNSTEFTDVSHSENTTNVTDETGNSDEDDMSVTDYVSGADIPESFYEE